MFENKTDISIIKLIPFGRWYSHEGDGVYKLLDFEELRK